MHLNTQILKKIAKQTTTTKDKTIKYFPHTYISYDYQNIVFCDNNMSLKLLQNNNCNHLKIFIDFKCKTSKHVDSTIHTEKREKTEFLMNSFYTQKSHFQSSDFFQLPDITQGLF